MTTLLEIGGAYKIKTKIRNAFFANLSLTDIEDDLITDPYIGQILTVLDILAVSTDNFYSPHHRYIVFIDGQVRAFVFMKDGKFSREIPNYLEKIA